MKVWLHNSHKTSDPTQIHQYHSFITLKEKKGKGNGRRTLYREKGNLQLTTSPYLSRYFPISQKQIATRKIQSKPQTLCKHYMMFRDLKSMMRTIWKLLHSVFFVDKELSS